MSAVGESPKCPVCGNANNVRRGTLIFQCVTCGLQAPEATWAALRAPSAKETQPSECGHVWDGTCRHRPDTHRCVLKDHARGEHKCSCGVKTELFHKREIHPPAEDADALIDAHASAIRRQIAARSEGDEDKEHQAIERCAAARASLRARLTAQPESWVEKTLKDPDVMREYLKEVTAEALWEHICASTYPTTHSGSDGYRSVHIAQLAAALASVKGGR